MIRAAEPEKLTAQQEAAIRALASGKNLKDAAAAAKVSDRTLRRWRQTDAAFESELREHLHSIRHAAELAASTALLRVTETLIEIATDPKHPQCMRAISELLEFVRFRVPAIGTTDPEAIGIEQAMNEQPRW